MKDIGLIRKIAWSFHKTTGIEWEELFQEAAFAYCKGLKTYNPDKGKITTYMYWFIAGHLKNYLAKELKQIPTESLDSAAYQTVEIDNFFDKLSKEAQEIADIVLYTPGKFIKLSSVEAQMRIINILHHRGWSEEKIQVGLVDLIRACQ